LSDKTGFVVFTEAEYNKLLKDIENSLATGIVSQTGTNLVFDLTSGFGDLGAAMAKEASRVIGQKTSKLTEEQTKGLNNLGGNVLLDTVSGTISLMALYGGKLLLTVFMDKLSVEDKTKLNTIRAKIIDLNNQLNILKENNIKENMKRIINENNMNAVKECEREKIADTVDRVAFRVTEGNHGPNTITKLFDYEFPDEPELQAAGYRFPIAWHKLGSGGEINHFDTFIGYIHNLCSRRNPALTEKEYKRINNIKIAEIVRVLKVFDNEVDTIINKFNPNGFEIPGTTKEKIKECFDNQIKEFSMTDEPPKEEDSWSVMEIFTGFIDNIRGKNKSSSKKARASAARGGPGRESQKSSSSSKKARASAARGGPGRESQESSSSSKKAPIANANRHDESREVMPENQSLFSKTKRAFAAVAERAEQSLFGRKGGSMKIRKNKQGKNRTRKN